MSDIIFGNRYPNARPTPSPEGRVGNSALGPRICRLPDPPPEPKLFEEHDYIQDENGEIVIVTGKGSTPQDAARDLAAQMGRYAKASTTTLRSEEQRIAATDPNAAKEIATRGGQAATAEFLRNHPAFYRDPRNQALLENTIRNMGVPWSLEALEKAYSLVEDSLIAEPSGKTIGQLKAERESEARLRPRRIDAPTPVISPEASAAQQAESERRMDDQIIAEFEAMPMSMMRRMVATGQRCALNYNAALERRAARGNRG
jgi:hypothetical protein